MRMEARCSLPADEWRGAIVCIHSVCSLFLSGEGCACNVPLVPASAGEPAVHPGESPFVWVGCLSQFCETDISGAPSWNPLRLCSYSLVSYSQVRGQGRSEVISTSCSSTRDLRHAAEEFLPAGQTCRPGPRMSRFDLVGQRSKSL